MIYTCVLTLTPKRGNQIRHVSNALTIIPKGNLKPSSRGFSYSSQSYSRLLKGHYKPSHLTKASSPSITTAISKWYNEHECQRTTIRFHSSRGRNSGSNFKLDALPFSISPEEALEKWKKWAEDDQSLSYLMNYNSIRIGAAFCPVWSFDLNIRFPDESMPPTFKQAFFSSKDPIHLPGLSAYAGYSYRRSLVNPVHSTSLVFLGDKTEPFGGWMLRDLTLQSTGAPISVVPDAWNTTEGRALQLVRQELQTLVDVSWNNRDNTEAPKVELQVLKSRRVYMPTFIIDYEILGLEYRAFVSGCDKGAAVAGVSHQIMGEDSMFLNPEYHRAAANFLTQPLNVIMRQPTLAGPIIGRILAAAWFFFVRIWTKVPIIGVFVGSLAGYRKIYQPWMDNKTASADWERERENEAQDDDDDKEMNRNDFFDRSGAAESYFRRHKTRILNDLGGPEHEQGKYDWFEEWQSWSRQQAEQNQSYQRQQQQQRTSSQSSRQQQQQGSSGGYQWDFDPNDPYSVLGLPRNATKEQASQAFRKQMLQHHPDTQPNVTEAQKAKLLERSKLITDAYRKIKVDMKRR
ncbi:unnamed protein product [Cylindrotheca closterium]|uniref:J domain-containing protein n=1 Tax=Cylindrotheca closterium TaxID=2856 RepID=A0AAD2CM03_9STRA|nr:unnamed protein product [Cylindrotheca closterium]